MRWTLAAALLAAAFPAVVRAHPLAPALLELRELGEGRVAVSWKTPLLGAPGGRAEPVLPARCRPVGTREAAQEETGLRTRWAVDCGPGGLVGERIGVGGLETSGAGAVVRVVLAGGRVTQGVLTAERPFLVVPPEPRPLDVGRDYAALGVRHIWGGPDHLLFVFGLVLLAQTMRGLLATVTGFTLGHSITLTAAALGLVHVPTAPIESAIAASVFLLAVELARTRAGGTAIRRRPWVMATVFGLLHGLGFAAALSEAGLPAGEVPLALLAFNLGIEAGQVLFVLAVVAARAALGPLVAGLPGWARRAPVYAMGSLAAFWWLERTLVLFR